MPKGARGAGDVQGGEVRATQYATGGTADGQFDDAVHFAVGREAQQATAVPARVPDVALTVHRRPVRPAAPMRAEPGLGGVELAVRLDRMPIQRAVEAVAEMHLAAVVAPQQGVGNAQAAQQWRDTFIRINAEKATGAVLRTG